MFADINPSKTVLIIFSQQLTRALTPNGQDTLELRLPINRIPHEMAMRGNLIGNLVSLSQVLVPLTVELSYIISLRITNHKASVLHCSPL